MGQNESKPTATKKTRKDHGKGLFAMIKATDVSAAKFERQLHRCTRRIAVHSLTDEQGLNLLQAVVTCNRLELLLPLFRTGHWKELLLKKVDALTATVNYRNKTAVQLAISLEASAVVKELHDLTEWEDSMHPVHKVARTGDERTLVAFLLKTSDGRSLLQQQDGRGCGVLYWASVSGNMKLVRQLIALGADPRCVTSRNETLLHVACQLGHVQLMLYLIKDINIDTSIKDVDGSSAVSKVGELGDCACLAKLLKCGLNPCSLGPALTAAALHAEHAFLRTAIEKHQLDATLKNDVGVSPLCAAIYRADETLIKYLFTKMTTFSDVGLRGRNLLHVAAAACNADIMELLLAQLQPKDAVDGDSLEALLINDKDLYYGAELCYELHCKQVGLDVWALVEVRRGVVDVFERRVADCADTEMFDLNIEQYGRVLRVGHGLGPSDVTKHELSQEYKEQLNAKVADMTPLHAAVFSNKSRVVEVLLKHGAYPNIPDAFGLTALHLAAMRGNRLLAELLVQHAARVEQLDQELQSPVDIARLNQHEELAKFLTDVIQSSIAEARRLEYMRHYETDLTSNTEQFVCSICFDDVSVGLGVVLKECLHMYCRNCLADHINYAEKAEVPCPIKCGGTILEREIKTLVDSEVYNKHLKRSVLEYEMSARDAWHCKTVDCANVVVVDRTVTTWFNCDVCGNKNCIACEAVHDGKTCVEYRTGRDNAAQLKSRAEIDDMLRRQEAMLCPSANCKHVITKSEGCDSIQCRCGAEICWATRGPRWGPNGRGDTSGGCRCQLNGLRCTPTCRGCH